VTALSLRPNEGRSRRPLTRTQRVGQRGGEACPGEGQGPAAMAEGHRRSRRGLCVAEAPGNPAGVGVPDAPEDDRHGEVAGEEAGNRRQDHRDDDLLDDLLPLHDCPCGQWRAAETADERVRRRGREAEPPRHEVPAGAPTSAAPTSQRPSAPCGASMMPLPMVTATLVPKNAPTRLATAAMPSAIRGVGARVETDVATVFAAS